MLVQLTYNNNKYLFLTIASHLIKGLFTVLSLAELAQFILVMEDEEQKIKLLNRSLFYYSTL